MKNIVSYWKINKVKATGLYLMVLFGILTVVLPLALFDLSKPISTTFWITMLSLRFFSGLVYIRD